MLPLRVTEPPGSRSYAWSVISRMPGPTPEIDQNLLSLEMGLHSLSHVGEWWITENTEIHLVEREYGVEAGRMKSRSISSAYRCDGLEISLCWSPLWHGVHMQVLTHMIEKTKYHHMKESGL